MSALPKPARLPSFALPVAPVLRAGHGGAPPPVGARLVPLPRVTTPPPRPSGVHRTGVASVEARARHADAVRALRDEHAALGHAVRALAVAANAALPTVYDVSLRAALGTLHARLTELDVLRAALAPLLGALAVPSCVGLLDDDAPLADYLRGLCAWGHATATALRDLADELGAGPPDWRATRARLEDAAMFHFDELADASLAVVAGAPALAPVARRVVEAADALARGLAQPFG